MSTILHLQRYISNSSDIRFLIAPLVGAALVSGVGSLIGGLIGKKGGDSANKTNLQIARETNQANRENQEYQNAWNLEQWNRENEYNSPLEKRKRLEAAGLNPIFYGLDGAGNAGSLQSAPFTAVNGAPMLNSGEFFGNSIANAAKTAAEINLINKQADNVGVDTDNKKFEGQILEVKAGNAATIGDLEIQSYQGNINLTAAQTESVQQDAQTAMAQMDWFRNQIDVNNKRYELDKISTFIDKYLSYLNYDLAERDYISRTAIANFEASTNRMNAVTRRAEVKIYGYHTRAEIRLMRSQQNLNDVHSRESAARTGAIQAGVMQSWDIHNSNKKILDNQVKISGNQAFASNLLPDTEYWRNEAQKAGIDLMEAQRIATMVNAFANMIDAVNPFSSVSPRIGSNPIGFGR